MSGKGSTRRFNPLTREWLLLSKGRADRPWLGQIESETLAIDAVIHDENCALCPLVARANGTINPDYSGVHIFDNDFPTFSTSHDEQQVLTAEREPLGDLFRTESEIGVCRVVCFSDNHSLTLAQMSDDQIIPVVRCFIDQTDDLMRKEGINHVQIFENRGETMGCSNPHPHGQIWAQQSAPTQVVKESISQSRYFEKHKQPMLLNYLEEELIRGERIVCENDHFAALVPYWAAWPYETMILPKRHVSLLTELADEEIEAFADITRRLTVRYDNLFQTNFPYSAGIHQRSSESNSPESFQLHVHYFPPLLRSASVRKFMVGYEMLCEPQRDLSPEEAASYLRNQSEVHYLKKSNDTDCLAKDRFHPKTCS